MDVDADLCSYMRDVELPLVNASASCESRFLHGKVSTLGPTTRGEPIKFAPRRAPLPDHAAQLASWR